MKRLKDWVVELLGGRVRRVPVVLASRRLDDSELKNALANAPGTPVWDGVLQVLMDCYEDAQARVSSPKVAEDPGTMAHAVGGMAWLGDAIGELQERAVGARQELTDKALAEARRAAADEVGKPGRR